MRPGDRGSRARRFPPRTRSPTPAGVDLAALRRSRRCRGKKGSRAGNVAVPRSGGVLARGVRARSRVRASRPAAPLPERAGLEARPAGWSAGFDPRSGPAIRDRGPATGDRRGSSADLEGSSNGPRATARSLRRRKSNGTFSGHGFGIPIVTFPRPRSVGGARRRRHSRDATLARSRIGDAVSLRRTGRAGSRGRSAARTPARTRGDFVRDAPRAIDGAAAGTGSVDRGNAREGRSGRGDG